MSMLFWLQADLFTYDLLSQPVRGEGAEISLHRYTQS